MNIDTILDKLSIEELICIKENVLSLSHQELLSKLDNKIKTKENIKGQDYNNHINLMEIEDIPINVRMILLENNIMTVADLIDSGMRDNYKTDGYISWIRKWLNFNNISDENKLTK